ncbi:MAG TPA: hypothetical protein VE646_08080 [Actinomycetota bacterium]|jgi:hypothetical protein|nr:hypothetical protein [Actinomycetota bacterium]
MRKKEGDAVSLRLDIATVARIEADRIYDLILPEMESEGTVTVPLPFLENVRTTGQKLEPFAPNYIRTALDGLAETAKIRRLRRKAVVPAHTFASVAAAFRIAADSMEGRTP